MQHHLQIAICVARHLVSFLLLTSVAISGEVDICSEYQHLEERYRTQVAAFKDLKQALKKVETALKIKRRGLPPSQIDERTVIDQQLAAIRRLKNYEFLIGEIEFEMTAEFLKERSLSVARFYILQNDNILRFLNQDLAPYQRETSDWSRP